MSSLVGLIVVLVVIALVMWAVNTLFGKYLPGDVLRVINVVVTVLVFLYVLLWLLSFAGYGRFTFPR